MFKWIKSKIKSLCEKIRFRRKLKDMDAFWYSFGGSCFGVFPPSFYYTHTQEEIEKLEKEEIAKLKKIAKEFSERHENGAGQ